MLFYLPLATFSLLLFVAYSVWYYPWAYYYTISNKRKIEKWQSENNHKIPSSGAYTMHWVLFIVFGPIKMSARLIVDTIFFFINLFKQVDDENIQETEDTLTYLNLEQFEMIEDIIHELHKDKDKNGLIKFRDVIKILQKRLQLFAKLKSQLFFIEAGDDSTPGRTQGTNTKEEWDDIRDRLKTFNLCK